MSLLRLIWAVVLSALLAATASAQGLDAASRVIDRPDPAGVPTTVGISLVLLDLVEIDDVSQEYTADVFIRLEWRDERLAAESVGGRTLPLSDVWWPQLMAVNRRELRPALPEVVRIDPAGNVTYEQRLYGTLAARMDLRLFPRDTQVLPVRLASYRYSPDEVAIEVRRFLRLDEMSLLGWIIEGETSEVEPLVIAGAEREAAGVKIGLLVRREVSYYVWTMGLPLLLICAMAWTVFWIDPSLLPSQLAISTASVFSLIAFRFSIRVSLPKVSYLTRADSFVLVATLLVFGALGHAVITGRLAKTGREDLARTADRWGRRIYVAVLVALILWILI